MSALPIPPFTSVAEVVEPAPWVRVIIAPDTMAGSKERFSVIRIDLSTGRTRCVGREVPLAMARDIAEGRR
jgi:hypothetical protein